MTVGPNRFHGITPDFLKAYHLKGGSGKRLVRIFVKIAHDIALAFAPRAWACPA